MGVRYDEVWVAARPYMRARKNDVHIPMAFDYALQLLEHHPEANRDVVLLAILLHDVGWAVVDQDEMYRDAFVPGVMESDIRIAHEREGARIAREVLDDLGWPLEVRDEVVAIIDGHDTRRYALSRNDELVKDADALWRYSVAGVGIACDWFRITPGEYADLSEQKLETWLFTDAAKAIARAELAQTRRILKTEILAADKVER